jgi:Tol biopolymer transport system component
MLAASMTVAMLVVGAVGLLVPDEPARAAFPGQNGRIAFIATTGTVEATEIYTIKPNGSELKRITNNSVGDYRPAYSPDGKRLAFDSYRTRQQVWVKSASSAGGAVRLTGTGVNSTPAWSPDGTKIVFTRRLKDIYDVWVMNADGTDQTNITNSPEFHEDGAVWSPDGTKIAFHGRPTVSETSDIYVMNADGTDVRKLTDNTYPAGTPDWSPDGTKLVFTRYLGPDEGRYEVYTMNADGTNEKRLTDNGTVEDQWPVWSPSGTRIAFMRNDDIWVMNGDGTGQTNVTGTLSIYETHPDWQPFQPKTASSSG